MENRERYEQDGKVTVLCTLPYLRPCKKYGTTYAADQVLPEISSCMGTLFSEGLFSDIVVVAEERQFPVHT